MTWIKICGITNLEDALAAVEAGADALGFVFYEKSPRLVAPEKAGEIIQELPEQIERVGVLAGELKGSINMPEGISAIQWTVAAGPEDFMGFGSGPPGPVRPSKLFVSFPVSRFLDGESTERLQTGFAGLGEISGSEDSRPALDALFLDSGSPLQPGGTGKTFDWRKALPIAEGVRQGGLKLVVAGGLTPGNVAEAMAILRPWGVDVSSGVEARPGKKDPEKVRAFIRAVREADKARSNN